MNTLFSHFRQAAGIVVGVLLGACSATTTVAIWPADQGAVCQPQSGLKAAVRWGTGWRADQKDVLAREAAAAQGVADFFAGAKCFASVVIARADASSPEPVVPPGSDLLLVLTVRELGPTVKLFASAALIDGGTEVLIDVARYLPGGREPDRQFTIHWRNGGPGVIKGVQSLPADMSAALQAGLGS